MIHRVLVLICSVLCVVACLRVPAAESNLLPNGGFETALKVAPERVEAYRNLHTRVPDSDFLFPARWTWRGSGGTAEMILVDDARTGARALRVKTPKGCSLSLNMELVEVVPRVTYSVGAWARGSGGATIRVYGQAYEGRQYLATAALPLDVAWQEGRGAVTLPGHIRRIGVQIDIGAQSDVLIDDVFFAGDFAVPPRPDAALNVKPVRDDHTLAFVDFDSDTSDPYQLSGPATVVAGGRFGKGLRLERKGHGASVIPLTLKEMPEQGTLELWFAPDVIPGFPEIHRYFELFAGSLEMLHIQVDTSNRLACRWRKEGARYAAANSAACSSRVLRDWLRPGQWHHVAVQWDGEAVRVFVNGVLATLSTDQPQPFLQTPSGIRLGSYYSVYAWSGMVDEVRLSDIQRYGPFVPVGAEWTPLVRKTPPPAADSETEVAVVQRTPPDYAALRKLRVSPPPPIPEDAYVFEADDSRPLFEGDPAFSLVKDEPLPGMAEARVKCPGRRLIRDPYVNGLFWKVTDIPEGRYYLGIWGSGSFYVYLNGRIVQLSTRSDPVLVETGHSVTEYQSASAELIRPGDEIAVLANGRSVMTASRLVLYPREPARGRFWVATLHEANWWRPDTAMGLALDSRFLAAEGKRVRSPRAHFRQEQELTHPDDLRRTADGKQALAECVIVNPLPVALKVRFTADIKAYFRELVGHDDHTLVLQPHTRIVRTIPFDVIADSARYTIHARVRAIDPPDLRWPAWDGVSFFDGLRQDMAWPNVFSSEERRAIRFSGRLPGPRSRFSLNGAWQSAFSTALDPVVPPPENAEWKRRVVPLPKHACPKPDAQTHALYMKRSFTMPAGMQDATARLCIEFVIDEATVYVNGQRVGNVRGGGTPLTCDISGAAHEGENDVLVVVRDLLAIMDPAYVNRENPVVDAAYLDAPGLFGKGAFAIGETWVEFAPKISVHRVLTMPSVREQKLGVRFAVTSHALKPRRLRVTTRVLDAGRPVADLDRRDLELAPEETVSLQVSRSWTDPELWGAENPTLYTLVVELKDAESGDVIDLSRTRFGFRETWIEGDRILFNGRPVRLKGSSVHGGQGVFATDIQLSRGTYIPDFMDEFGSMASRNLAQISNSSSRHNVDHDPFWEAGTRNVLAGAERYGNHACIIAWDLSNEWLCYLDYSGGDPLKGARRFKTLSNTLQDYDPTRFTFFNGDEDLHGLHDTFSTHYMVEATNPHPLSGFKFRGHSNYYPDGAFFRPLDQELKPGDQVVINTHRNMRYTIGSKPIMNTENVWKTGHYMPPGPSRFAGDNDVLSAAFDSAGGAVVWMWKMNVDGHRDLGCSAIYNYSYREGLSRRAYATQCFIMPDHTHHGFAGQSQGRAYSLHNDLLLPAEFLFAWRLSDVGGKTLARGEDRRAMDSGDIQRGRLSFDLPDVTARTRLTLRLELRSDDRQAYAEDRDIDVWPDRLPAAPPLGRKIYLLDSTQATATVLEKAGVSFERLDTAAWPVGLDSVVVIGEHAVGSLSGLSESALSSYVEGGGRVLVLAQSRTLAGLPVRTSIEPKEWTSMPFVRTPQHPVLHGVTSWDLKFWNPDHVTARGAYSKPRTGAFITLLDSGGSKGMESVQMMECYRGNGSILLNQLPVIAKYDIEPMCRELLGRLIAYMAGDQPFRQARKTLALANPLSPAVRKRLEAVGVTTRVASTPSDLSADATILVDAATLPDNAVPADILKSALIEGATVLLHHVTPEQAGYLQKLCGENVSVYAQPYANWEGRAFRNAHTWLNPGISHLDLYWKRYEKHESGAGQADHAKYKIEDIVYWSVSAPNAVEHIFPGALVEIPVGKGRVIIDQIRWETEEEKLGDSANRLVSSMMTALGVEIAPYMPIRGLPKDVRYETVDLSPYANRGFLDEKGGDGEGGWSDQGPTYDMRTFPTGRRRFGNVPFEIGQEPHCCIVLKSSSRPFPEKQPAEVTIPVGRKAEGLYFLHSLTYAGGGLYQVLYEDGTKADIVLVNGVNIRDWIAAPAGFPEERMTRSRVAWTGSSEGFPQVSVFSMLWVNPAPEKVVKAVRFANPPRKGCPVLIGLTLAVSGTGTSAIPEDLDKAQQLLTRGIDSFRKNEMEEAKDALEQAIVLNPGLDAARQQLGRLHEQAGRNAAALAVYRDWVTHGAATPYPWNRIGEILESQKDYAGALEAYVKSLEIEWNQPPTIVARSRVEKLLAEAAQ